MKWPIAPEDPPVDGRWAYGSFAAFLPEGETEMAETPWFTQKPVVRSAITTVNQAAAYAHGSYTAALSKCPSAASVYKDLRDSIVEDGNLGPLGAPLTVVTTPIWNEFINKADAACKSAASTQSAPTAVEVTNQVPPGADPYGPGGSAGDSGGSSGTTALLLIGVGIVAYLLFKKKK